MKEDSCDPTTVANLNFSKVKNTLSLSSPPEPCWKLRVSSFFFCMDFQISGTLSIGMSMKKAISNFVILMKGWLIWCPRLIRTAQLTCVTLYFYTGCFGATTENSKVMQMMMWLSLSSQEPNIYFLSTCLTGFWTFFLFAVAWASIST